MIAYIVISTSLQNHFPTVIINDIEQLIEISKFRSVINVNTDTLTLYWNIGNSILHKQEKEGWGKKVIEQLSKDLNKRFPYDRGYSERNLKYMRQFSEAYPDFPILQIPLSKLRDFISGN